jgi:GntR family transcriptional repressor for pyruvate dehydrogenase complex
LTTLLSHRDTSRVSTDPPPYLGELVLRPVRGHHAFEACVERLGTAIRFGILPRGSTLPSERDLADRLQVSRATLREAIVALREAGWVETRRGRHGGTVVLGQPTSGSARSLPPITARRRGEWLDALAFRRIVEPGAARLAAQRSLTETEYANLTTAHEAVARSRGRARHREADSRFHLTLAMVSGSERLVEAVTSVQAALHEMLAAIPVITTNIAHSDRQHLLLVRAVLAGRAERAEALMRQHCDDTAALLHGLLGLDG